MWPEPCSRRSGSAAWVTPERAEDVRLELIARLLLAELLDHAELPVAGVVDDDVQAPEVLMGAADGLEHGLAVGDVQRQGQ